MDLKTKNELSRAVFFQSWAFLSELLRKDTKFIQLISDDDLAESLDFIRRIGPGEVNSLPPVHLKVVICFLVKYKIDISRL